MEEQPCDRRKTAQTRGNAPHVPTHARKASLHTVAFHSHMHVYCTVAWRHRLLTLYGRATGQHTYIYMHIIIFIYIYIYIYIYVARGTGSVGRGAQGQ